MLQLFSTTTWYDPRFVLTFFFPSPQVLFSVPWAVASEVTTKEEEDGGGQGLAIGVLNIAIVVPQVKNTTCTMHDCYFADAHGPDL
jgi:hypothetical protein